MRRRTLTLALLLVLVPASLLLAGSEGRLKGVVQDKDGKPIVGAKVVLMAQEVSAAREAMTKKGGKFVMIVADATRSYMIRIEADGYQTVQEPVKLTIGGQTAKTWTLLEGETVAGATMVEVHAPGAKVYNDGAKAFNNGDIDGALAKFREAGEINPELAEAFQGQAMIHWSRKETDMALVAAEKVVALAPTNVLGLRVCYDSYLEKGDERASAMLEALIAADPTPATARRVFNSGVASVRANDADGAIAKFEKAVEIDSSLTQGYQILGQLYNSKSDYDMAIAKGEQLLAMVPDSPEAHSVLYKAYKAKGDTAKADASWAILKESKPEDLARTFFEEGKSLWDAGKADAAAEQLQQAVDAYPEHDTAHYYLGLAYANINRVDEGLVHLQKFLELNPGHPEAASAKSMLDYYKSQ